MGVAHRTRRCQGLMHAAPCHSLPPPANSPATMLGALRQRSGIAATAFAGLLPHPLLVLTTSRSHCSTRAAAQQHAHAVYSPAQDIGAQPDGALGRRAASGRSRNWSPEQQHAREVDSSADKQRGEASHASQPYSTTGRGRGRGVSRGRGRGGEAGSQLQAGSDRAVSSSAGHSRGAKGRGGRPFGGLPSAGRRSRGDTPDEADSDANTGRVLHDRHSAATPRGQHSGAGSQRLPSSRRSGNTPGRQQRQPMADDSQGRAAQPMAALAAASAAATSAAAAVPDAVPRNAGITGGRWDVNDAALVERTLKDADTLRRKFADQGARVKPSRLLCCRQTRCQRDRTPNDHN